MRLGIWSLVVILTAIVLSASTADAQQTRSYRFYLDNWTRVSGWDYFDPGPSGGDPTYSYIANRLRLGFLWQNEKIEVHVAAQGVQFGGLPDTASGPGPLGLGAVYRGHGGGPNPGGLYVRYLYTHLKDIGNSGLSLRLGRMGYAGGSEGSSDRGKINRLRSMRVGQKLIGEFGWSQFQRSFDGVRVDWNHGPGLVTLGALQPTQGGFEERAGVSIDGIRVYTGAWTLEDDSALPGNELQFFIYDYSDDRPIDSVRPDNTGQATGGRMNLDIRNFGFHAIGAYPLGPGELDSLVWYSYQTGSWFDQPHRAQGMAFELGYQWDVGMRPWLRAGYLRGTGDEDGSDQRHGTFFQMLPTTRLYSLTTTHNLMNNTDLFVQALLAPTPDWSVRIDYHHLGLSNAADRWYFGAGATQAKGTVSGYGVRASGGETAFGKALEVQATRTINRHWSITGYYGHVVGGNVVRASFPAGRHFNFAFIENALSF